MTTDAGTESGMNLAALITAMAGVSLLVYATVNVMKLNKEKYGRWVT